MGGADMESKSKKNKTHENPKTKSIETKKRCKITHIGF